MRLVGYLRTSTLRQGAADRQGLPVQEKEIRRWARTHGHRLVAVLRDVGVSGEINGGDRPGLAEAINIIRSGRADGIVAQRLDRLARKLTVQEAILALVWHRKGRVFATDAGEVLQDDPDDPMRTFVRQVMGAAAQLERAMISARLRGGRKMKAERGGFAFGAPPFGYRAVGGKLVADADEQAALGRIHELHKEGRSLRSIAESLTQEGHQPRRGGRWHPTVLATLIRRQQTTQGAAFKRPRRRGAAKGP